MRYLAGVLVLFVGASWLVPAQSTPGRAPAGVRSNVVPADSFADPPSKPSSNLSSGVPTERLTYDIEWRLIHAGAAVIEAQKTRVQLKLQSAGLVSTLFKVDDTYSVNYDESACAQSSTMDSQEGKRHRETTVTFDHSQNRATFVERDLLRNSVIRATGVDIPGCVHDVLGALIHLRSLAIEPGQSTQVPVSDGRRFANVKLEAQEREEVRMPLRAYKTVRYEANLMNGVVYTRKGAVFVWVTDDAQHLPVQIRLRMGFPVGTVTLQLLKEEHF